MAVLRFGGAHAGVSLPAEVFEHRNDANDAVVAPASEVPARGEALPPWLTLAPLPPALDAVLSCAAAPPAQPAAKRSKSRARSKPAKAKPAASPATRGIADLWARKSASEAAPDAMDATSPRQPARAQRRRAADGQAPDASSDDAAAVAPTRAARARQRTCQQRNLADEGSDAIEGDSLAGSARVSGGRPRRSEPSCDSGGSVGCDENAGDTAQAGQGASGKGGRQSGEKRPLEESAQRPASRLRRLSQ